MHGGRERLRAWAESSVIKKRHLFGIHREEYLAMGHRENGVDVRQVGGEELDSPEMRELLRTEYAWNDPLRWARHREVDLLVAFEDRAPIGYYMTLAPEDGVIWHDELPVPPSCGLVFKGFVEEEHRGKGVYRALQRA